MKTYAKKKQEMTTGAGYVSPKTSPLPDTEHDSAHDEFTKNLSRVNEPGWGNEHMRAYSQKPGKKNLIQRKKLLNDEVGDPYYQWVASEIRAAAGASESLRLYRVLLNFRDGNGNISKLDENFQAEGGASAFINNSGLNATVIQLANDILTIGDLANISNDGLPQLKEPNRETLASDMELNKARITKWLEGLGADALEKSLRMLIALRGNVLLLQKVNVVAFYSRNMGGGPREISSLESFIEKVRSSDPQAAHLFKILLFPGYQRQGESKEEIVSIDEGEGYSYVETNVHHDYLSGPQAGQSSSPGRYPAFSIGYKGAGATKTHVLQFLQRRMAFGGLPTGATAPTKGVNPETVFELQEPISKTAVTVNQTYDLNNLTTDFPTESQYYLVDSTSNTVPFYDESGRTRMTGFELGIADSPTPNFNFEADQGQPNSVGDNFFNENMPGKYKKPKKYQYAVALSTIMVHTFVLRESDHGNYEVLSEHKIKEIYVYNMMQDYRTKKLSGTVANQIYFELVSQGTTDKLPAHLHQALASNYDKYADLIPHD